MEVQVREEGGLAFQYPERITGQALDGWSLQTSMGGMYEGRRGERDKHIEVDGWER